MGVIKLSKTFASKIILNLCNLLEMALYFSSVLDEEAGVVKLVDTLDLGSSAARCAGSIPVSGIF